MACYQCHPCYPWSIFTTDDTDHTDDNASSFLQCTIDSLMAQHNLSDKRLVMPIRRKAWMGMTNKHSGSSITLPYNPAQLAW